MRKNDSHKLLYNELWLPKNSQPVRTAPTKTIQKQLETPEENLVPKIKLITAPQEPSKTVDTQTITPTTAPELITDWNILVDLANNCTNCGLCYGRTNVVIERGNRNAKWLFVGEGPGENEDLEGKPFVGRSGQLLDKMITACNLDKDKDVYICNVVKCRPPQNRNPSPEEASACSRFLLSQIQLVQPQVIVALGRVAAQMLLQTDTAIGKLRGTVQHLGKTPLVVTYHPAYLLRNPPAKKDCWEDLQLAMTIVN